MITVHYLNNSRAQRILFMLEELGIEYETNVFFRVNGLAPPNLKEIHPLGKSPVITDGDLKLAESGAIVEYLANKYGKDSLLVEGEPDDPAVLNNRYWMHYAEGSLTPPLLVNIIFNRIKHAKVPFFVKPISNRIVEQVMSSYIGPNITAHFGFVEDYLSNNEFFGGDRLTTADVMMLFPLEGAMTQKSLQEQYPKCFAYVNRMQARPSYQRALEKGEPYDFAQTGQ